MTSRRKFLLQCSAVAAVAAVPASLNMFSASQSPEVSLDTLGFAAFSRVLGTRFNVSQRPASVRLELIEFSAGGNLVSQRSKVKESNPGQFSLIFRGAKDQPLSQNTYTFQHDKLGRFSIFIVPVRAMDAASKIYYQAVFNRPTGAAMQAALKARPQKSPRLQARNAKRGQTQQA